MKPPIKSSLFVLLIAGALGASAQDINFSQFYDLPLLRNPALAGIFTGDVRITAAYRNQWQSVTVPYKTFGMGLEYKKPVGKSGDFITLGMQLSNDIAGDSRLSRIQVFPVFNYHKLLNENKDTYLSAGFMVGPVFQRFDPSKLSFDDQFQNGTYSPANPTRQTFSNTSLTFFDAAAGLCFSSSAGDNAHYYVGVGMFHLTSPKIAFQAQNDVVLNRKFVVNAGLSAPLGYDDRIVVYADYFMQGGNRQGQGGALFTHDFIQYDATSKVSISGGVFYRWNDAIIPVIRYDYMHLGFGFAYDVNMSKLKTASQYRGGYELTLVYKTFLNTENSSANKVQCPVF